ncbi:hypothetical protein PDJAM_G00155590, partial [Pangasius djambal]|nr:hypothetical protein [Pangasius djambal]
PCTADYHVRHTVLSPHILWKVGKVVQDPGCKVLVHPCVFQLVSQKRRMYSVESTRKIKKHDSHSAPRIVQVREGPVQEEDDCIVHPNARLVCKLEWDVFHSCGTLPSLRLIVKMNSTIPHSWSAQDLRSLALMPSGPAAFLAFIFLSAALSWSLMRD